MKNRKGQFTGLVPTISVVVFVSILVVSGFVILQQFYEQDDLKNTVTITNETTTAINQTGYTNQYEEGVRTNGFTLVSAWDGNDITIPITNLSMSSDTGLLTNVTLGGYGPTTIVYTYQRGDTAYLGVNSTISGLQTIPNFLGILILILVVGIVLAVIFNAVPTGRTIGA